MVTESLLFGLLAGGTWGVQVVFTALALRRTGIFQVLYWLNVASLGAATIYLVVGSTLVQPSLGQWGLLVTLSVFALVSYTTYYLALREGPISIVAPIDSAHSAVAVILAVLFVGERLNLGQSLGATVTILGVVLAAVNLKSMRIGQGLIGKGPVLAVFAMVLIGTTQFLIGRLSQDLGWFLPVYLFRVLTMSVLVMVPVVRRQWPWQGLSPGLMAMMALIGFLDTGAAFSFARGSELGLISIVAAASTIYPLAPLLWAVIFLHERLALNQMIGIATVLGGLLLLSLA